MFSQRLMPTEGMLIYTRYGSADIPVNLKCFLLQTALMSRSTNSDSDTADRGQTPHRKWLCLQLSMTAMGIEMGRADQIRALCSTNPQQVDFKETDIVRVTSYSPSIQA
jgi:hypothetical protein